MDFDVLFLLFVIIWLRYECLKSDNCFQKLSKMRKKWLIEISEELETNFNSVFIFFFCF